MEINGLTEEQIAEAVIAFREKTGRYPTAESGDASKYLGSLTNEKVAKAIKLFHSENGFYPTPSSGEASKYFGDQTSWMAIDAALKKGFRGLPGGSTLVKEVAKSSVKISFSTQLIADAMEAYHKEHGKHPVQGSGDASKYFGFKTTWAAVNESLRCGYRGLPGGSSLAMLRSEKEF